jgi:hypothetical protein
MAKQLSIYAVASILLVIFAHYAQKVFLYLDIGYHFLNIQLAQVFSSSETGIMFRKITVLMMLPLIIVGTPALIYRLIKKGTMPYFYQALWLVWLTTLVSELMI